MIAKEIRNVQYMRSVSYISETMIEKLREPPKEEADSLVVPGGTPYGDMRRALPKFARKKSMNIIQGKKEAMFEEAQRVRRVDAYLKNIEVFQFKQIATFEFGISTISSRLYQMKNIY